jgi:hypothetical protein
MRWDLLIWATWIVLVLCFVKKVFDLSPVAVVKGFMSELKSLAKMRWSWESINALGVIAIAILIILYVSGSAIKELAYFFGAMEGNEGMDHGGFLGSLLILTLTLVGSLLCVRWGK